MSQKKSKTAIAVLFYKNPDSLLPTLNSLIPICEAGNDVWVVNNGSNEDVSKLLKISNFKYLKLEKNFGYCGGYNRVFKKIFSDTNVDDILILNPDIIITKKDFDIFTKEVLIIRNSRKNTGLFQPLVLLPDGKINTSGNEMNFCGFAWTGRKTPEKNHPNPILDLVTGCAMIFSRELFETEGGFDEDYFAYYEDTELSLRLGLKGYSHFLISSASVTHFHDHNRNSMMWRLYERNRWRLILTYFPTKLLILISPALFYTEILAVFVSFFQFSPVDKMRAWIDIFLALPNIIRKRKIRMTEFSKYDINKYLLTHTKSTITYQYLSANSKFLYFANLPLMLTNMLLQYLFVK